MKRIAFAMIALAALPAFAPAPFPTTRRRAPGLSEVLQGTWTLEKLELAEGGRLAPSTSSTTTVRVAGKRWLMLDKAGDAEGELEFALDETNRPARIDFSQIGQGLPRLYSVGIVKVDGDALTLAWVYDGSGKRPTGFDKLADGYRGVFRRKR